MKQLTLQDIAKIAGVSAPLASVALSGKTDGTIKLRPETRKRICKIAKELNYKPNIFARNLKTNKSFLIGVLLFDVNKILFGDFIRGVQKKLSEKNYSPIFMVHATKEEQRHNIDLCMSRRIDGIIINSWINEETGEKDNKFIFQALPKDFPCVEVFGSSIQETPSVCLNFKTGFYNLCKRLIDSNCKKIAFMCHKDYQKNKVHKDVFFNAMQCYKGYIDVIKEFSLPKKLMLHPRPGTDNTGKNWGDYAYELTKEIFRTENPPDAIACLNSHEAAGVIKACNELNLKIPENLSVCACSDPIFSDIVSPSITTCDTNPFPVGMHAAEIIFKIISGETVNSVKMLPETLQKNSTKSY